MDSTTNGIDVAPIFGPVYWGLVVALILSGVSVLQAYTYFPRPTDRLSIQIIAATMSLLDFVSTILVVQSIYYYMIPNFGSLIPLESITPTLNADCLLSALITLISQLYFVTQIYSVTQTGKGHWSVPAAVALFAILTFVSGVACTATMFIHPRNILASRNLTFNIFAGLAKAFGAITDIIATIAMCKLLSSSKTGMKQTNSLLKSIMNYVIHRGIIVTLVQVLLLISFYATPHKLYWLALHLNVTKLYCNTFFALLNGRDEIRKQSGTVTTHTVSKNRPPTASFSFATHSTKDMEAQDDQMQEDKQAYNLGSMPTVTKTIVISTD